MNEIPKFLLTENFLWLLQQLHAFDDPSITYSHQGMKDVRGGHRRIYRHSKHFNAYYKGSVVVKKPSPIPVTFGAIRVECDEFDISHPDFEDKKLKERFPAPGTPPTRTGPSEYTVLVTSKKSIEQGYATRYYVSCDCMDFQTTFKEKLIAHGYTNGAPLPSKGIKKLAPAICKHIYAVLMTEYKDIIEQEDYVDSSPVFSRSAEVEPDDYNQDDIVAPPSPPTALLPKKADYEKLIRRSLKFFNNVMPNGVEVYKNSRQTNNAYKRYKFMVKKYFQGYVIVFTNPLLNPLRDKTREKEIMPLVNRTAKGMIPAVDAIVVYTKKDKSGRDYFTKDELMSMIKAETKEIQPNQIEKLKKTAPTHTLTESLELVDNESSQILTLLLGLY